MTKIPSRRKVLKVSGAYGFGFAGLASSSIASVNASGPEAPTADSDPRLFRLVDSGFDRSPTVVRLRSQTNGRVAKKYSVHTTGTNHPSQNGRTHEERFPTVAADIDSFRELQPGEYKLEVHHEDLAGETTFSVSRAGIPDSIRFYALIMPDGRLRVGSVNVNDPVPAP